MSPEHLAEWKDLTSGLALLCMGPPDGGGTVSELGAELIIRARAHVELDQVEGMEHVSALMMGQLLFCGKEVPSFAQEKWSRLSREYHHKYCPEEPCVARRNP